ncbi:hypothetical protein PFISCL1PPCAC_23486, partial [Pristionchus fissidentatus]
IVNLSSFSAMFVFYDCLWKLSITLLSATFTGFRIIEYISTSVVDIEVTKDMAWYSQAIHMVSALLFVFSLLSRNTFITVLTIATLVCQTVFTYKHYTMRECTNIASFTGQDTCDGTDTYFEAFNKELFSIYLVAVTAIICILCINLYVNYLENCIQQITTLCEPAPAGENNDRPKTSVVSVPSNWSGKHELLVMRSQQRRDSGNFSA